MLQDVHRGLSFFSERGRGGAGLGLRRRGGRPGSRCRQGGSWTGACRAGRLRARRRSRAARGGAVRVAAT
eukprot:1721639-Rhodomonas_salina.2